MKGQRGGRLLSWWLGRSRWSQASPLNPQCRFSSTNERVPGHPEDATTVNWSPSPPGDPTLRDDAELLDFIADIETDVRTSQPTRIRNQYAHPNLVTADWSPERNRNFKRLPGSPLIDEEMIEARNRYRLPKPRSTNDNVSSFTSRIRRNTFANILASDVRMCALTGVRLPRELMLDFKLLGHPETGDPWILPVGLDKDSTALERDFQGLDGRPVLHEEVHDEELRAGDGHGGEDSDAGSLGTHATQSPNSTQAQVPITKIPTEPAVGSRSLRIMARGDAMSYITSKRGRRNALSTLIPWRWKELSYVPYQRLVWREDMEAFILRLLQKKVVRHLLILGRGLRDHRVKYFIPTRDRLANLAFKGESALQPGAVLFLRYGSKTPVPARVAVGGEGRQVPLYDLKALLLREDIQNLKDSCRSIFIFQIVLLREKRFSLEVLKWLWILQQYVDSSPNVPVSAYDHPAGQEDSEEGLPFITGRPQPDIPSTPS